MDLLASLVLLAIWLVVVAVVIGVLVWAVQHIWPQAPPIVGRGLMVLGVLIALYLVLVFAMTGLPKLPVRP